MRIIGGKFRGRRLEFLSDDFTRPTMDRVRECIFNVLGTHIRGAVVLDLFGGSGAFSAEALSRGASSVIVNDIRPETVDIIKKNLAGLGNAKVLNLDYKEVLKKLNNFDIAFIDPPYWFDVPSILDLVNAKTIVVETDKNSPLLINAPHRVKEIGRALVYFITRT